MSTMSLGNGTAVAINHNRVNEKKRQPTKIASYFVFCFFNPYVDPSQNKKTPLFTANTNI